MYRFIPSKRNSRRKSSTTCRRGGNVGAEISIGPGASRSFSLSHPGPRTTHASAPDAPPLPSPLAPPAQPPQFPSHPRRLFSLSLPLFLYSSLARSRTNPLFSLRFSRRLHIFAVAGSPQGSAVSTRIPPFYAFPCFRSSRPAPASPMCVCVCLPLSLSLDACRDTIDSFLSYSSLLSRAWV